jgi:hypothetical protein
MESIIGDAFYDHSEELARTLEQNYSVHPIFPVHGPTRERTKRRRGGEEIREVNGVPYCKCGPMKLRGRDYFYDAEQRLMDGKRRGSLAPNTKEACVRWDCPRQLCPSVSLQFHHSPRDHCWWPRGGDSKQAQERRALERYREIIESIFSEIKDCGIGTYDLRALWARDAGMEWLVALHLLLRTARAYVHETGIYGLFHDEYRELGLHIGDGNLPNVERMREVAARRPTDLRWRGWQPPGRATD